jgi:hypothetical protein
MCTGRAPENRLGRWLWSVWPIPDQLQFNSGVHYRQSLSADADYSQKQSTTGPCRFTLCRSRLASLSSRKMTIWIHPHLTPADHSIHLIETVV